MKFEVKLIKTNHQLLNIYNNRRYYSKDVVEKAFREIKRRERFRAFKRKMK